MLRPAPGVGTPTHQYMLGAVLGAARLERGLAERALAVLGDTKLKTSR